MPDRSPDARLRAQHRRQRTIGELHLAVETRKRDDEAVSRLELDPWNTDHGAKRWLLYVIAQPGEFLANKPTGDEVVAACEREDSPSEIHGAPRPPAVARAGTGDASWQPSAPLVNSQRM